jgi:hypothetical protein
LHRTRHRWALDADSLGDCTRRAGVVLVALPPLVADLDKPWQARLEANGRHDNLYLVRTPA